MSDSNVLNNGNVRVDFVCIEPECKEVVKFNLLDCASEDFKVTCPKCGKTYDFDEEMRGNLKKLLNLILAIREAGPVLGDCNVAVAVPGGEIKLPYAMLLTRLNSLITLPVGDKKVDFRVWIEPAASGAFR